jgi:hypothetical protein
MNCFSKTLTFALSILSVGACIAESEQDDLDTIESAIDLPPTAPALTACLSNAPHDSVAIPSDLSNNPVRVRSGNAAYADDADGCSYFIVDFHQFPLSNNGFDSAFGGRSVSVPVNQLACEAYRVSFRIHTRHSSTSGFSATPRLVETVAGRWTNQRCVVDTGELGSYDAPQTGRYIHRLLVRVHTSGTPLQAEAYAAQPAVDG